MRRTIVTMLLLSSTLFSARASADDIWQSLIGHWQGSGEVSGMTATIALQFRPAFGGRGYHLDFQNSMRGKDDKTWQFAAEALYRCDTAGACRGHWYDSRGMILPLSVTVESDRLLVEWGDASTERGRTTYRLDEATLRITDEVLGKDGAWKVFGTTSAARKRD
jgi:hypothetical protein